MGCLLQFIDGWGHNSVEGLQFTIKEMLSFIGYWCQLTEKVPEMGENLLFKAYSEWNIVAAFRGMHVSPANHRYAWLPRKCDYQESVTTGQTDRQTPEKVIPMCRYASQATQKARCHVKNVYFLLYDFFSAILVLKRRQSNLLTTKSVWMFPVFVEGWGHSLFQATNLRITNTSIPYWNCSKGLARVILVK